MVDEGGARALADQGRPCHLACPAEGRGESRPASLTHLSGTATSRHTREQPGEAAPCHGSKGAQNLRWLLLLFLFWAGLPSQLGLRPRGQVRRWGGAGGGLPPTPRLLRQEPGHVPDALSFHTTCGHPSLAPHRSLPPSQGAQPGQREATRQRSSCLLKATPRCPCATSIPSPPSGPGDSQVTTRESVALSGV